LFATLIADEGRDFVEVGVAQEIRDGLEPSAASWQTDDRLADG
jgi:hypothetical protein